MRTNASTSSARRAAFTAQLLIVARSAVVAFEEHLDCLEDELRDPFCDRDDVQEQIDNYQYLLDQHREVLARATAEAA